MSKKQTNKNNAQTLKNRSKLKKYIDIKVPQIEITFSFEQILHCVKGLDKERLQYASAKWEFMRRNNEFQEDLQIWNEEIKEFWENFGRAPYLSDTQLNSSIQKLTKKLYIEWGLGDPSRLCIQKSFDEHVEIWAPIIMSIVKSEPEHSNRIVEETHLRTYKFVSYFVCNKAVDTMLKKAPIYYKLQPDPLLPHAVSISSLNFDTGKMALEQQGLIEVWVDLTSSKRQIRLHLEEMIDKLKPHIPKQSKARTVVRNRHTYDLYPTYMRVYDMREKNGLTYNAIAEKFVLEGIFIDDLNKDPRGPEIKIIQYCQEAKRIIDNVADF